MSARRLAVPVALYAVVGTVVLANLRLLWHPEPGTAKLALLLAAGAVPAVAAAVSRHRVLAFTAASLVLVVAACSELVRRAPLPLRLLGGDGWLAAVAGELRRGAADWPRTTLPLDPVRHPELSAAVGFSALVLLVALGLAIIVLRAPFASILIAAVPITVVSTVYTLDQPLQRGLIVLGTAVLLLALLDERPLAGRRLQAAAACGAVVLIGGLAAGLPGVSKAAFVDWRSIGQRALGGTSVSYVWDQTYGPLQRPRLPVDLLRIRAAHDAYLRATALEEFNGAYWSENTPLEQRVVGPMIAIGAAERSGPVAAPDARLQSVRITNIALNARMLVVPAGTAEVAGVPAQAGGVWISAAGALKTDASPPLGASWTAVVPTSVAPKPAQLERASTNYGDVARGADLGFGPYTVLPWGTPGQVAQMSRVIDDVYLSTQQRAAWHRVHAKILDVTRGAANPYEAALALERWFQTAFHYDERADYQSAPQGPLAAFMLGPSKAGYCQMFSGSMAAALRMLGIPARVATGFATGRSEGAGSWVVSDRDAHAWVEAYFPGYGWLAFEPTPGRTLDAAYSSTSAAFAPSLGAIASTSAWIQRNFPAAAAGRGGKLQAGPHGGRGGVPSAAGAAPASAAHGSGTRSTAARALLAVLAIGLAGLALLLAAKRRHQLRALLARDDRELAAAVRADLAGFVADQHPAPTRSLTAEELAGVVWGSFGVEADRWAAAQARARFGPRDDGAHRAARIARRETRRIKRDLRRTLDRRDRLIGAVRLRSLR